MRLEGCALLAYPSLRCAFRIRHPPLKVLPMARLGRTPNLPRCRLVRVAPREVVAGLLVAGWEGARRRRDALPSDQLGEAVDQFYPDRIVRFTGPFRQIVSMNAIERRHQRTGCDEDRYVSPKLARIVGFGLHPFRLDRLGTPAGKDRLGLLELRANDRSEPLSRRDLAVVPRVDAQFRQTLGDRGDEGAIFLAVGNEDFRHALALAARADRRPRSSASGASLAIAPALCSSRLLRLVDLIKR